MSACEKTINHIVSSYAANWSALTKSNGLDAWMAFLTEQHIEDYIVNETMRKIVQGRMDDGRFDSLRDKPKLIEFRAVYYQTRNEHRKKEARENPDESCSFCENRGFRWIITATNGYSNPVFVTKVPEDPTKILMFPSQETFPCTCQRGIELKQRRIRSIQADGRFVKPMEDQRHYDILTKYSLGKDEAIRLFWDYIAARNRIHFPKTTKEKDEDAKATSSIFKYFMKNAKKRVEQRQEQEQA